MQWGTPIFGDVNRPRGVARDRGIQGQSLRVFDAFSTLSDPTTRIVYATP